MRQLLFEEPGRVAWHEAPDPQLTDPAGALVAPLAVARCDLDRRFLPEVLELVAAGRIDPLAVPTTVLPWDRADEAWLEQGT
jgi:hypothetical protein